MSLFKIVKQVCLVVNVFINWGSVDLVQLLLIMAYFELWQSFQKTKRFFAST